MTRERDDTTYVCSWGLASALKKFLMEVFSFFPHQSSTKASDLLDDGSKDDDDDEADDEDEKLSSKDYDPERLKAFNVSTYLPTVYGGCPQDNLMFYE